MSEKEETENVEDVQIDKESLKTSLENAIKDEIRSQWNSFLYTIIYQKEVDETGFMTEVEYRIFLDSDYNIPRKTRRENWVSEEKEAFNLFYGLGFDSFKKSKTVGRDEDENTYQLFEVGDEQVSHMMDEGYWISMDDVDFLLDIHNTELESIIRSLHSLAD